METNNRTFYTVSKADLFSVSLGVVMSSIEASHESHRAVVFEDDKIKIQNAINQVKHDSAETAKNYAKFFTIAWNDKRDLEREQGI